MAQLVAACSTGHLKLKYHLGDNTMTTLHEDIDAARRCCLLDSNLIELDPTFNKSDRKELKKEKNDPLNVEILRPIPDGDFELVPFGDVPSKSFEIGKELPELVRAQLIDCIRENVDLFAWSAGDMPKIDPSVACHQLCVSPNDCFVAQQRRKQSPDKSEATEKAVKDLLEENFISEAKYRTWLSNVVLVKKSNGKRRKCVDYTDLNRACHKDAYPLPNRDKLVDSLSGYKLLPFMDAYSGYNQIPMAKDD